MMDCCTNVLKKTTKTKTKSKNKSILIGTDRKFYIEGKLFSPKKL